MFCAISGQVAQEPVFSPKTGLLYESRLVRKALDGSGGKCPVTGVELDAAADLCEVKSSAVVLPRPPNSNSFPAILATLQNEWDSLLLEQVALRKELLETRKDLATTLYEREAASGVIARLIKENERLKAELQAGAGAGAGKGAKAGADDMMDTDEGSPASALARLVLATEAELVDARKDWKSKPGEGGLEDLAAPAGGAEWKEQRALTPHKSSKPGATCVAAESFNVKRGATETRFLVSGGVDGNVCVLDAAQGDIAATLSGHKGRVNDVSLSGGVIASASADKTVKLWTGDWTSGDDMELKCKHTLTSHAKGKGAVAAQIHPSNHVVLTAGAEGLWALSSMDSGDTQVSCSEAAPVTCARFHPDGKLVGIAGKGGALSIYDVSADPAKGPAIDALQHGGAVPSLSFSQNGYLVASACDDGLVRIWDLRSPAAASSTVEVAEGSRPTAVQFDDSGIYLAVGDDAGGVQVLLKPLKKKKKKKEKDAASKWGPVVELFQSKKKKPITGLVFANNAASLWTASMDNNVSQFQCSK